MGGSRGVGLGMMRVQREHLLTCLALPPDFEVFEVGLWILVILKYRAVAAHCSKEANTPIAWVPSSVW